MSVSFCGKRLLLNKRNLQSYQKRYGYIVLVPEIGEDLPDKNPLLREDGLLEFNNVTIEKCVATIGKQAVDVEINVKTLQDTLSKTKIVNDIFHEVLIPLENFSAPLETTWGLAKTLYLGNSTLMPTKSYLSIHDRARRARLSKYCNTEIYKALKEANQTKFAEEQKRVIKKYLLEGKLNGIEVDGTQKLYLNEIMGKLIKEREIFRNKVNFALKQFTHTIEDYNSVREFPPKLLQATCVNPAQPTKGPWKITLEPYILNNFLEYCDDKTARWNAWQADTRKASGYTEKSYENSTHVETIRSYRNRQAKLLGYKNIVEMSMETKMVGDLTTLRNTLQILLEHAKPAQELELENLQKYAEQNGFTGTFEQCDVSYWKRKYSKNVLNYDEEILREYFPLPKVLSGLFDLCEKLFNIKIEERHGVETWHEDVKFYDIFDLSNEKDGPVSGFYLDLYAREEDKIRLQENPGWMVGIRNRSSITNTTPLSALIFNFVSPLYGKPSLLSFQEIQVLFNKFGHTLQHLLTRANYSEVAGVSNIEWDAVAIPGNVLSSFLYDRNVLGNISSHCVTHDSLPQSQIDAIINNGKLFAGYNLSRELYFTSLDLDLHIKDDFWLDIVKDLWPKFNVFPLDKRDSYPCSWLSVFSGEWGAAYFSHIWSRLVAADAYSAFIEEPAAIQETGKRFRDTFLGLGGGCQPSEVFRRFRGRDPSTRALIASLGIKNVNKTVKNEKK